MDIHGPGGLQQVPARLPASSSPPCELTGGCFWCLCVSREFFKETVLYRYSILYSTVTKPRCRIASWRCILKGIWLQYPVWESV